MQESIQLVIESLPYLLKGAVFTLQLSIGGMFWSAAGICAGADADVSVMAGSLAGALLYLDFRGTPLIAQLFMIYYGLPQFGIELDPHPGGDDWFIAQYRGLHVRDAARGDLGYRQGTMGSGGEHWHDAVANATSRYFAAGGSRCASAVEQQLYQPGERYVARRDDSGAGVVPPRS